MILVAAPAVRGVLVDRLPHRPAPESIGSELSIGTSPIDARSQDE
jgi:hypothetical protein